MKVRVSAYNAASLGSKVVPESQIARTRMILVYIGDSTMEYFAYGLLLVLIRFLLGIYGRSLLAYLNRKHWVMVLHSWIVHPLDGFSRGFYMAGLELRK